jgi:hypothetical protein
MNHISEKLNGLNPNLNLILEKIKLNTIKNLCVISTKNPTNILIDTILKVKEYYPDFDIIVIDSDSNNFEVFQKVPSYVKIEYIKNKKWELGAWYYAFYKYNMYDIYMFIQDSITPIKRLDLNYNNIINSDWFYSFHYTASLKSGDFIEELHEIYKNSELQFICDINIDTIITGAAHSSFIANRNITKNILKLEQVYISKNILSKSKIDCWLSERTVGIMADKYSKKRIDITNYFNKYNLKRDY